MHIGTGLSCQTIWIFKLPSESVPEVFLLPYAKESPVSQMGQAGSGVTRFLENNSQIRRMDMGDLTTQGNNEAMRIRASRQQGAERGGTMTHRHVRYMTVTALLSAVAFVLQFFEFPIPLMPSFIKMDFSDLPELIGAFAMGPASGVAIALIKNLLHLPLSQTGGVGELCNFLLGASFALPAGLVYKFHKTKNGAIAGAFCGALTMAVLSFPINYFITYPFYELMMPREVIVAAYQAILPSVTSLAQCLLVFNVPFTLFKALCSVAVTMLIYKKLSPILHGQ